MKAIIKSLATRTVNKLIRAGVGGQEFKNPNLGVLNRASLHRVLYFNSLFSQIENVPGVIVECGVGQGRGLAVWTSLTLTEGKNRKIWAFDSFEGFPQLVEQDEATEAFTKGLQEYKQFDIPYVRKTLLDFGLSSTDIDRQISMVKGFIPNSCKVFDGSPVALLYIDVDIYEGYRDSLEFFFDNVSSGGIIAFDEYLKPLDTHKWPGAAKAINEFLDEHSLHDRLQICSLTGNRYMVKP